MPTGSEAATAALSEAEAFAELATLWGRGGVLEGFADTPPIEAAVVRFFDPTDDLERRGSDWGYQFTNFDLADLARFAAGLAAAEADGWGDGLPDIATRAYADRRFLLSDRLLHWAVPWLDALGRCYPVHRGDAHRSRDVLLDLGDRHRPAPDLAQGEGIYQPGHDAFGPLGVRPIEVMIGSLWSGAVIMRSTLRSMTGTDLEPEHLRADDIVGFAESLSVYYEAVAARWNRLAADRPGSAALWRDLSTRASATAERF